MDDWTARECLGGVRLPALALIRAAESVRGLLPSIGTSLRIELSCPVP